MYSTSECFQCTNRTCIIFIHDLDRIIWPIQFKDPDAFRVSVPWHRQGGNCKWLPTIERSDTCFLLEWLCTSRSQAAQGYDFHVSVPKSNETFFFHVSQNTNSSMLCCVVLLINTPMSLFLAYSWNNLCKTKEFSFSGTFLGA